MRYSLPLVALVCMATPLAAQDHSTMDHAAKGHSMPATTEEGTDEPAQDAVDHSTMDHAAMGHAMPAAPASDETPPARAFEGPRHAADAIWSAEAMQPSRDRLAVENGGMTTATVMIERLEARISDGEDGYLWDAQGWYGGDLDKIWVKTEGEGAFDGPLEDTEIQALWSHAIAPFFDLQAGARLDMEPETRTHLVIGVQGLAPYMWEIDTAAFLSDRGDLTARIEVEYDQRITQRLILQPRAEIALSAQDIPERVIGAGVTRLEAGLRLRYEFAREFAPYIGVEYETAFGATRRFLRAAGEDPNGFVLLAGIRAWF